MKKKLFITYILGLLLFNGCSSTNVVSSDNIPKSLHELQQDTFIEEEFYQVFDDDITFWGKIYEKYDWNHLVYYTPDTPSIIEIMTINVNYDGNERISIFFQSPSIDSVQTIQKDENEAEFIQVQKFIENIQNNPHDLNVLSLEQIRTEAELHYDYLNQIYQQESNSEKDIGMTRGRKSFYEQRFAMCQPFISFASEQLKEKDLPEQIALLVFLESGCNPRSQSDANAAGIWQMIPETARKYGLQVNQNIDERFDPILQTDAALAYLEELVIEFQHYLWAINAYHSGEGNLRKAQNWADEKHSDLNINQKYIRIVQDFADDRVHNNDPVYFYGRNSARYTTLFVSIVSAYSKWEKSHASNQSSPQWWADILERKAMNIEYPEETITTAYTIQSGDTLSEIATRYFLDLETLQLQINEDPRNLQVGKRLEFQHPYFETFGNYLRRRGRENILNDQSKFCQMNPSIIDCLSQNLDELLFAPGTTIFYE